MLQTALDKLLAAQDSPTADLFFLNACGDFLLNGVRRLGPTVFSGPGIRLVMRHDLGAAETPSRARSIYFIDDAVEAGAADRSLPFLYRQKLRLVERAAARRLAPGASAVVVGAPALVPDHAGAAETHVLHPYWSEPVAGTAHFAPLLAGQGWVEIAYLGSRVHRADLAFLWPVLAEILRTHPTARLHLSERHRVPTGLRGHPRIRSIPAHGWSVYRAALRGRRFHLALYPLMDTPFNGGRSINKLIEHGVVGAAPLYSRAWPESTRAVAAGAGLALENRAADWGAAIAALLARPERMLALAEGAAALARRLNQPGPQRRLWARLMEVRLDAAA